MSDIKVQGIVYRQQSRKCGNPRCKCQKGELHGPYWYKLDGSGPAKYVGKDLPEKIKQYESLLKASSRKIRDAKKEIEKRRDQAFTIYSQAQEDLRSLNALEAREHVDAKSLENLGFRALVLEGER